MEALGVAAEVFPEETVEEDADRNDAVDYRPEVEDVCKELRNECTDRLQQTNVGLPAETSSSPPETGT